MLETRDNLTINENEMKVPKTVKVQDIVSR